MTGTQTDRPNRCRTCPVPPGTWTVVLADRETMRLVELFHNSGRVVTFEIELPPDEDEIIVCSEPEKLTDGFRSRVVPFADSDNATFRAIAEERAAAERTTSDDGEYHEVPTDPLTGHPANQPAPSLRSTEQAIEENIALGYIERVPGKADTFRLTESGKRRAEKLMGAEPGTIV